MQLITPNNWGEPERAPHWSKRCMSVCGGRPNYGHFFTVIFSILKQHVFIAKNFIKNWSKHVFKMAENCLAGAKFISSKLKIIMIAHPQQQKVGLAKNKKTRHSNKFYNFHISSYPSYDTCILFTAFCLLYSQCIQCFDAVVLPATINFNKCCYMYL